MLFNKIEVI